MEDMLLTEYAIHVREKLNFVGKECYKDDTYFYFIIPSNDKEIIHMEQAALTYYLYEKSFFYTTLPIPTKNGEWFTTYGNKRYMVVRVEKWQQQPALTHGRHLAEFHEATVAYPYEPKEVSSYGQWKNLWINKLTQFESIIIEQAKKKASSYYRLVMDILPYFIGISENAIQYVQESESDHRYHETDRGVIAFRRYKDNIQQPIIWLNDFVYDHPTRDLAEFIRHNFLQQNHDFGEIKSFIKDYESIRPLSIFSWRLLYARLLYPIHLYDLFQKGIGRNDDDNLYIELEELLNKQVDYEKRLAKLFDNLDVDYESFQIPVVHWL